MDLQWKRDMRQGVVTCLCEVGLGCGAFPWIGGAQQEKQMVFGACILIHPYPKTSSFYILPKIHKENCPGRPIVSTYECPTVCISTFFDIIL